jgi:hypothetical protein
MAAKYQPPPPPLNILIVGSQNITWQLEIDPLLVYMVGRRGFKIWLRNIKPPSPIHLIKWWGFREV